MTGIRVPILVVATLWALGLSGGAVALTCTSTGTGNWNNPAIWSGCSGGVPGAADTAVIANLNHTVTVTADVTTLSVSFTAGNQPANLVVNGGVLLTVNGTVTIGTPTANIVKRLDVLASGQVQVNGNFVMNGGAGSRQVELRLGDDPATRVTITGNFGSTAAGGAFNARALITFSGSGTLEVGGTLGTGATFTRGTGTVKYNGGGAQNVANYGYHHLSIEKTGGSTANTVGGLTVNGNLAVTGGTLIIANITAAVSGTTDVSSTLTISSATGAKIFSGNVTINGTGTWNNSGNAAVGMGGNLTNNGTFNAGTGTYSFIGAAAQSITGTSGGTTTFGNLTLNNTSGLSLAGTHDVTVATLLTLTTGAVTTDANILTISNGSDIASAGGTDFVVGNLRKSVPAAGNTRVFEIGAGASYLPVTLVFTSVGTGGDLTVTTTAGEHPNVATSGLDDTLDVNRYWTLDSPTIASVSFGATFTWAAADLDAGADTSVFQMQRYSPPAPAAGTWNSTTTAANGGTSIQISGVTGFGDFAVGQPSGASAGIGRFNAYDTATAGGAVTGFITTKVAGAAFSVAVVALANNRKSINTNYKGTVQVELLDASINTGTLDTSTNCNTSWTLIQNLPNLVFDGSESGRKNMTVTENNAWRQVRLRMTDGGLIGCSTDAFAIRPASFTVSVTDADWATAGPSPPGRVLNNTSATGGAVHKAGRPFRITVTPATSTNYDGDPAVATGGLACTLPAGCVNGTLTLGAFTGSGTRVSDTATYTEAGAFNLTLEDRFFAVIDAADGTPADCSATGRFVCQSPAPAAVGRFVPDRFEFTSPSTPTLVTFNDATCGTRSFTYAGQPFWYAVGGRPSATLSALEAGGMVTSNYALDSGSSRPSIVENYTDGAAPATLDQTAIGTPSLSGAGTGTYMADMAGLLSYTRNTTTPVAPFTAAISLTVTASDSTESGVTGNGTITAAQVFNGGGGIAFDAGAQFRYGRLAIRNASGSQLVPLLVQLETQYWNGTSFITNAADNCTSIAANNIELASYTSNLNACDTSLTVGAFSSGRATVLMSAPGAGNNGSVVLTPHLEQPLSGTPTTCIGGVSTSVASADRTYLQGNWTTTTFTENPFGRATFGIFKGSEEVIFMRENF